MAIANKTVVALDRRYQKLHSQRSQWEKHWQELADYMLPRKAEITKERTESQRANLKTLRNVFLETKQDEC